MLYAKQLNEDVRDYRMTQFMSFIIFSNKIRKMRFVELGQILPSEIFNRISPTLIRMMGSRCVYVVCYSGIMVRKCLLLHVKCISKVISSYWDVLTLSVLHSKDFCLLLNSTDSHRPSVEKHHECHLVFSLLHSNPVPLQKLAGRTADLQRNKRLPQQERLFSIVLGKAANRNIFVTDNFKKMQRSKYCSSLHFP